MGSGGQLVGMGKSYEWTEGNWGFLGTSVSGKVRKNKELSEYGEGNMTMNDKHRSFLVGVLSFLPRLY